MGLYEAMDVVGILANSIVGDTLQTLDGGGGLVVYAVTGLAIYLMVAWFLNLFKKSK